MQYCLACFSLFNITRKKEKPVYEDMTNAEGRIFFPKVWTLTLAPLSEDNLFVNFFQGKELRYCAEFRMGKKDNQPDEVFFFIREADDIQFLKNTAEIFLYGAHNTVYVQQIRARGVVKIEENDIEIVRVREKLKRTIKSRTGKKVDGINNEEAGNCLATIKKGQLFRFSATSYAGHICDRS